MTIAKRAKQLIARAEKATDLAEFQEVYRDARAEHERKPFAQSELDALANAFNAATRRLVAL